MPRNHALELTPSTNHSGLIHPTRWSAVGVCLRAPRFMRHPPQAGRGQHGIFVVIVATLMSMISGIVASRVNKPMIESVPHTPSWCASSRIAEEPESRLPLCRTELW